MCRTMVTIAKLVQRFTHFCEKTRMNIEGLRPWRNSSVTAGFVTLADIQTRLLELGAHPASAVSKNTDFLIVGEKAGSKSGEYLLRKCQPRRWALLP